MQNYFPVPLRYHSTSSLDDDGEWGAKLVGVFFVVVGVLTIIQPATSVLRPGTMLMIGALGVPAMAAGAQDPWVAIVVGCLLVVVGAFVALRKAWAHWAAMAMALVLFVPAVPYITLAGILMIWVLWRGRPRRPRPPA